MIGQRLEIAGHLLRAVTALGIPVGIPMAPLVDGQHAIVGGDTRDEIVPEMGFVAVAVEQDERNAGVAPLEAVQFEPVANRDAEDLASIPDGTTAGRGCGTLGTGRNAEPG